MARGYARARALADIAGLTGFSRGDYWSYIIITKIGKLESGLADVAVFG
jgi:hypothetical protein